MVPAPPSKLCMVLHIMSHIYPIIMVDSQPAFSQPLRGQETLLLQGRRHPFQSPSRIATSNGPVVKNTGEPPPDLNFRWWNGMKWGPISCPKLDDVHTGCGYGPSWVPLNLRTNKKSSLLMLPGMLRCTCCIQGKIAEHSQLFEDTAYAHW